MSGGHPPQRVAPGEPGTTRHRQKEAATMRFVSIKRMAITVGMAAALAVGTGIIPNATNHTSTAQAAEMAQHGGGQGGGHGGGHGGQNFRGNGGGHHGGGHGSFQGRNFRSAHG